MHWIKRFQEFIRHHNLCDQKDRILLAVSGGPDSMVMTDLFLRAGYSIGLAHCNFGLREDESDADEQFVRDFALRNGIPFHTRKFDTRNLADESRDSIQMTARDLRYAFFEEQADAGPYNVIATAHHLDDDIETLLINLVRGTGIRGLAGIPVKRGRIIRPLKFLLRSEIEEYAKENEIASREDSSNAENKYLRNKIRQKIIPDLEKLNPDFKARAIELIQQTTEAVRMMDDLVDKEKQNLVAQHEDGVSIILSRLDEKLTSSFWLFELLREYGFTPTTIGNIRESLKGQPGKVFYSPGFRAIRERGRLRIQRLDSLEKNDDEKGVIRTSAQGSLDKPVGLSIQVIPMAEHKTTGNPGIASLDLDKLKFPLIVRRWEQGDRFIPLGMEQSKKISDFLIDNKVELSEKEKTCVVESGDHIVWIVGHRISNLFRVTENTRQVYQLSIKG
jgi:tRNA(Ile)-lysidine synthase